MEGRNVVRALICIPVVLVEHGRRHFVKRIRLDIGVVALLVHCQEPVLALRIMVCLWVVLRKV